MGSNREDHIAAYNAQAERLAAEYEALDPTDYQNTFASLLPRGSNLLALDVGAGSGRDAAWLAGLGFEVVAAEPASGMRSVGQRLHDNGAIRWIDDRLPATSSLRLTRQSSPCLNQK